MNLVFIFGMARSGTTWLQRVINSTGELLITGEHLGFLKGIAQSYYSFFEHRVIKNGTNMSYITPFPLSKMQGGREFIACKAGLSVDGLKNSFRNFLESVINTYQFPRWGFKEINYGTGDRVIELLLELYPSAKMIFLVRNPYDQICSKMSSGWWPQYSFEENVLMWRYQVETYMRLWKSHPDRIHLYRYEDLIADRKTYWCDLRAFLELGWGDYQDELVNGNWVGATPNKVSLTQWQRETITVRCAIPELYPV